MANLIDESYFHTDISIPESANQYGSVGDYISKFEKEVLVFLLGYELFSALNAESEPYKELINGGVYEISYNGKIVKLKWPGLKNAEKISLISHYIYCEYLRKSASSLQQVGNFSGNSELSSVATILPKIYSAYSEFEEMYGYPGQSRLIPSAYNYLSAKKPVTSEFDSWIFTNLKGGINGFDL